MANKRVVDLPQAEKMLEGDILHIIQNGQDKQIPANKVGGDGIKQAETLAEAEAMVRSGDLEDGDIVLVKNDNNGVPSPSELQALWSAIGDKNVLPYPSYPIANNVSQLKTDIENTYAKKIYSEEIYHANRNVVTRQLKNDSVYLVVDGHDGGTQYFCYLVNSYRTPNAYPLAINGTGGAVTIDSNRVVSITPIAAYGYLKIIQLA